MMSRYSWAGTKALPYFLTGDVLTPDGVLNPVASASCPLLLLAEWHSRMSLPSPLATSIGAFWTAL